MKRIQPSSNKHSWPRQAVPSIECRERDLIIRIADWSQPSIETGEPSFDVEVYIGGVYDWNESETLTLRKYKTKDAAKAAAITFAQRKIKSLL